LVSFGGLWANCGDDKSEGAQQSTPFTRVFYCAAHQSDQSDVLAIKTGWRRVYGRPYQWDHINGNAMKTTVKIADPLLSEARKLATSQGVTLRELIERGLHRVLAEARSAAPFKLRRASFRGKGLQPEFRDAGWDRLRDAAYEDHGA
jgi:hypothetical protein